MEYHFDPNKMCLYKSEVGTRHFSQFFTTYLLDNYNCTTQLANTFMENYKNKNVQTSCFGTQAGIHDMKRFLSYWTTFMRLFYYLKCHVLHNFRWYFLVLKLICTLLCKYLNLYYIYHSFSRMTSQTTDKYNQYKI